MDETIDKSGRFSYPKVRFKIIIQIKAENGKVEKGNVTERRCHRLQASFTGNFLKCIRELIR